MAVAMIILVGVGHVFDIARQVRQIILENAPVAVGLELDMNRFQYVRARAQGQPVPEPKGMLAKFQARIAEDFGVQPGDEMVAGFRATSEINAKLYLIDMDIMNVLMRFRKQMTFGEKLKWWGSMLAIPFIRKKTVEKEMERYSQGDEDFIEQAGKSFPTLKKVLLDDRNVHMAKNLREMEQKHDIVLALVGDGHIPGLSQLLKDCEVRVIRIDQVRNWQLKTESETSISYSFNA